MIRKFIAGVSLIFISFSFAAAASKPNLVLITLSSTRADRMGFLGAKGALTPNLDRLAGESIVFEGRRMTVTEMDGRRIKQIRVEPVEEVEERS